METSDSNNEDGRLPFIFLRVIYFHVQRTQHNIHIFIAFYVEHNVET